MSRGCYDRVVTAAAPVELLVLCSGFALSLAGALAVILRLAFMMTIPGSSRSASETVAGAPPATPAPPPGEPLAVERSNARAQAVAGALVAVQRREQGLMAAGAATRRTSSLPQAGGSADGFAIPAFNHTVRRTRPRTSASAALRDRRP